MRILTVLRSTNWFLTQPNLERAASKSQPLVFLITNTNISPCMCMAFCLFKAHTHIYTAGCTHAHNYLRVVQFSSFIIWWFWNLAQSCLEYKDMFYSHACVVCFGERERCFNLIIDFNIKNNLEFVKLPPAKLQSDVSQGHAKTIARSITTIAVSKLLWDLRFCKTGKEKLKWSESTGSV